MKVLKRGKEEGFASVIFYSILVATILLPTFHPIFMPNDWITNFENL